MNRRKSIFFFKKILIFFSLISAFQSYLFANEQLKCDFCKKNIAAGSTYYKSAGNVYCSKKCVEKNQESKLPVCSACKAKIRSAYLSSNGKTFCSDACYQSSLPLCSVCGKRSASGALAADNSFFACPDCMKKTPCFSCLIPCDGRKLPDGRVICRKCSGSSITNETEARRLFHEVRSDLKNKLGIGTSHPIRFFLVDQHTLHQKSKNNSEVMTEQGLFEYLAELQTVVTRDHFGRKVSEKEEKTSELFRIYALDSLPKERMQYVMAHELAHDWMVTWFPGIRDPAVKEGFAEYVAWRYNHLHGRNALNKRIESNHDPVYGGGFRKIKAIADKEGFDGLKRYLNSQRKKR